MIPDPTVNLRPCSIVGSVIGTYIGPHAVDLGFIRIRHCEKGAGDVSRRKEDLVKTILVGVDGSPGGQKALEFAAREAAVHGSALRLLSAWEVPAAVLSGGGVPPELYENFEGESRKILDAAVARVKELEPSVVVEARTAEGHPGNALVDATEEADLVVIGRRGHGGLAEFLLGVHQPPGGRPRQVPGGDRALGQGLRGSIDGKHRRLHQRL